MTDIYNKYELKERRKNLRNNATKAEQILWKLLKNKQIFNLKFRRQFSFGFYIVDFYCKEKRLAIEVDGDPHFEESAKLYDTERTKFLNNLKVIVIRFTNEEIFSDIENVCSKIENILRDLP